MDPYNVWETYAIYLFILVLTEIKFLIMLTLYVMKSCGYVRANMLILSPWKEPPGRSQSIIRGEERTEIHNPAFDAISSEPHISPFFISLTLPLWA